MCQKGCGSRLSRGPPRGLVYIILPCQPHLISTGQCVKTFVVTPNLCPAYLPIHTWQGGPGARDLQQGDCWQFEKGALLGTFPGT